MWCSSRCARLRLRSCYANAANTHDCSNLARYTGVTFGEGLDASETQGSDLPTAYAHHRSRKFGCAHSCWLHNLLQLYPVTYPCMARAEVQRRIVIGRHAVSAQVVTQFHGKAQSIRSGIQQEFTDAFARVDVLLTPSGAPSVGWYSTFALR